MYAIMWLVLIGVVGGLIGNMAGQDLNAQRIFVAEPSALEMILGTVGATVSCYLFLYTSSAR